MKISESLKSEIKSRYDAIQPALDERMRRLWAAAETIPLGHGGITALSEVTGLSRIVIRRGVKELGEIKKKEMEALPGSKKERPRIRRPGAGPKPLKEKYPNLVKDLESLVDPETRGDPMSPLRWTTKSLRTLAAELRAKGYEITPMTVEKLLHELNYRTK